MLLIFFSWFMVCSCKHESPSINHIKTFNHQIPIIPAPGVVELKEDKVSFLKKLVFFPFPGNSYVASLIGKMGSITSDSSKANVISHFDSTLVAESYVLDISDKFISIRAADASGLQYALTSLAQLIEYRGMSLPIVHIEDSPKFKYRGMHLDVARHFFNVDEVKKYLDYMAYYKFNNFHWHLTDDQGWRIEILKYPKLQEVAASRKETLVGHYNDEPHRYDGQKYEGYYTQEEIRDVVAYAMKRNINVIPEIEMPGHAQAALAAYPELGCGKASYEVATDWGVFGNVFCPNEVTFKFLEDVIDEVITLFPGKYIHIGGDECPKDTWRKSAFCQQLMKDNKIKDEHGLQSYFISRMEKYINSKGKQIVGWDEIMEGGLAPNATVMSWRGMEGGLEAARQNHDVIMTPGSHCYFDHYQADSDDEPLAIGGLTALEKVYSWEPIPEALEADKKKYILGGQANLWTEYIDKYSKVEYMAYAREIAMSEALWSRRKDYKDFLIRYEMHNDAWKSKGVNIANHLYQVKPKISAGNGKPVTLSFLGPEGMVIDLSSDSGTETIKSNEEFNVIRSGKYSYSSKINNHKGRTSDIFFNLHKGTTASIKLAVEASEKYPGNGAGSLVNGVLGSSQKYGGAEWLGFEGSDCVAVLDFGQSIILKEVKFRFFKGEGQWIYLPRSIEVFTSYDGKSFKSITSTQKISSDTKIAGINIPLNGANTQFLKIKIANYGKIPQGAAGAGHKAWLFVDEIEIN